MENNKNKKSVKFQRDLLNYCDFIQVFVFTSYHHLKKLVQCILRVLFGFAAVNKTRVSFTVADVQTTCMSLYNFCVSITAVQSLFLWSFSLPVGLQ